MGILGTTCKLQRLSLTGVGWQAIGQSKRFPTQAVDDIVRHHRKLWRQVATAVTECEDRTKQHYMWPHDPEYVTEMNKPDFDPHIGLAVFSGTITEDEEEFMKWYAAQQN